MNWNQQQGPGWNNQGQQQGSWMPQQATTGYGYGVPRTMDTSIDTGLRSFMIGIYNYMAIGLVITGIVAYFTFTMSVTGTAQGAVARVPGVGFLTPFGAFLWASPMKWVIVFAPLAMLLAYSFFLANRLSAGGTRVFYFVFCALMGLSLAAIFFRYQLGSIAQVFFMTAAAFGALSLWGYTTKRNLTGMGSFLIMGLVGLMIASIVNIFLASSALAFAISIIGLMVFAGLTAWDTQRLKESYYDAMDQGEMQKLSVDGALSLYLNFVNIFQLLLSLFGIRNEE
jgi:FtsH-binding integral membrane protein